MEPVCVPCKQRMRCEKNSEFVVIMTGDEPTEAYQIWTGDRWKCPACDQETITGWGNKPVSECFDPGFQRLLVELDPTAVT